MKIKWTGQDSIEQHGSYKCCCCCSSAGYLPLSLALPLTCHLIELSSKHGVKQNDSAPNPSILQLSRPGTFANIRAKTIHTHLVCKLPQWSEHLNCQVILDALLISLMVGPAFDIYQFIISLLYIAWLNIYPFPLQNGNENEKSPCATRKKSLIISEC